MKKIVTLGLCLLFVGVSLAAAAPKVIQPSPQFITIDPTGTFEGNIGIPEHQGHNATIVGDMNGSYWLRNRRGRFMGDWETENRTGTIRGIFGRHIFFGRVSIMVNGTTRTFPIIGFLRIQVNNSFIGRFMAPIGPALYFWGTYT
ncbi:hypothetical protein AYK25_05455 [Thermoplasmatales archaeon SM1-50]|nr:MAG: hypothetical protein AYK25_05455 [Thermoplasmatales archaeon SM1-50]